MAEKELGLYICTPRLLLTGLRATLNFTSGNTVSVVCSSRRTAYVRGTLQISENDIVAHSKSTTAPTISKNQYLEGRLRLFETHTTGTREYNRVHLARMKLFVVP